MSNLNLRKVFSCKNITSDRILLYEKDNIQTEKYKLDFLAWKKSFSELNYLNLDKKEGLWQKNILTIQLMT